MQYHWEKQLQKKKNVATLKESIFKNKNQINSTVVTRTWVLSTKWTRTRPSAELVSKWKNGGGPRLFSNKNARCCYNNGRCCFQTTIVDVREYRSKMVDVVLQGLWVLYHIRKDEGDKSLLLSSFSKRYCQCHFSEIFKGNQIILKPSRNSKYLVRCLL